MKSNQAQVAAICRKYIKSLGIACTATSNSFSMGDSVTVTVTDQPPEIMAKIEEELGQYQYGHFDGMTDMYDYSNSQGDIPQTKYLSVNNSFSSELKQVCWSFLRGFCQDADQYPELLADVPTDARVFEQWVSDLVWQTLNGGRDTLSNDFWTTQAVQVAPEPIAAIVSEGVTIREGTRAGFSEVVFSAKPGADVRAELKAAGFRWSPKNSVWYGKTENLPFDRNSAPIESAAQPATVTVKPIGDKLRTLAEKMQPAIDDKFANRQTNTPKRQGQAAHARFEGERLTRTQSVLVALAGLHDAGTVPPLLAGLNSKKSVYDLMNEKSDNVANGFHAYCVGNGQPRNSDALTLAAWELLTPKSTEDIKAEALQRKIEGLQFSKIPGFFPTPKAVIEEMVVYADLDSSHTVLEPNLGSCAIADYISPMVANVRGFEINHTLCEIAQEKGYLLKQTDFMHVDQGPIDNRTYYDRVLMNPPFENLQDIDHVQHAFRMLKPGGRLVSIMSPSAFFRSDLKSRSFRQWFEKRDALKVTLPENSFKVSGTSTNSVMVVIDKGILT